MEPFSITCPTCQARLRVRNASAIGQILACPKCASMVLVEPPEGAEAASDAPGPDAPGPEAPEAEAPEAVADATGTRPARTFKFREDYSDPDEDVGPKPIQDASFSEPPPSARKTTEGAAVAGDPDKPIPPQDPAPVPARHRVRQWLILAIAAISGIVLAVMVVGMIVSSKSKDPSTRPTDPTGIAEADPSSQGSPRDKKRPPESDPPDVSPPPVDPGAEDGPPEKAPAEKNGDAPRPDESANDPPPTDKTRPTEPRETTADPTTADGTTGAGTPSKPDPETAGGTEESPPGLIPEPAADAAVPPDAVPPAADPGSEGELSDMVIRPPRVDVAARLSVVVPAIESKRISVADFVDLMSDFIAVPITLDVDAMFAAKVVPEMELEFELRQQTVGQLLDQVLAPLGLVVAEVESGLLITGAKSRDNLFHLQSYDISDLAASKSRREALGRQLVTLIAPSSWLDAGGPGKLAIVDQELQVQQSEIVHYQIARLLDRLRSARGLPARSGLPAVLLDPQPAFQRAAATLTQPLASYFPEPTALERVLDYLQSQTNLRILVDWQSCSQAGWWPTARITMSAEQQPFGRLLDQWLERPDLGYRLLDAKTLQIRSHAALIAQPELEIYRLAPASAKDPDRLIAELTGEFGNDFLAPADGAGEAILFDAPSASLLVALPAPRQRKLAAWLATHGKTLTASSN